MTNNPSVEKVRAVLANLPVVEDRRPTIDQYANIIALSALLAEINDQPMAHAAGTKKALKELYQAGKAGFILARTLNGMHNEAHIAISSALGDEKRFIDFQYELFRVTKAVYTAHRELTQRSIELGTTGAPQKASAKKVTEDAAEIYEFLTGKEPTRRGKDGKAYGPFHDFLKDIFSALDIDASAESQAKLLMEKRASKKDA
jgi:hypothetical protein